MKTQLFISSMILAATLTVSLNSKAESNSFVNKSASEIIAPTTIPINTIIEEDLQLEAWMSDNYFWKLPTTSIITNEPVAEEKLRIEDWMTNDVLFRIPSKIEGSNDNESSLCIEKWMTDKAYWRL